MNIGRSTAGGPTSVDSAQRVDRPVHRLRLRRLASSIRRALHLSAGLSLVMLGMAGVVLPGLPATPFLLLASYFLARCSPHLDKRLRQCPLIGQLITDWDEKRGVKRIVKLQAVGTIVLCVGATAAFSSLAAATLMLVGLCAAGGILIVCLLPSVPEHTETLLPSGIQRPGHALEGPHTRTTGSMPSLHRLRRRQTPEP